MRYGSVCSGIEAATVAWHSLGWEPAWFAEIENFPSAVLQHHYPDIDNLGDMTLIPNAVLSGHVEAPDLLVGGTPCQAFSVAGLRNSLEDNRGQLSITYIKLLDAVDSVRGNRGEQPAIALWENVPGVLSTKDNAFWCFLAGLAGEDEALVPSGGKWTNAGYVLGPKRAVAWRVLDAQYFGVAQRRRRVFVVASAREDFSPPKVLFEFEGMRRDTPPSREKREDVAGTIAARFGISRNNHEECVVTPSAGIGVAFDKQRLGEYGDNDLASTCAARDYKDATDLVVQPINIYGGNGAEELMVMAHGQANAEICSNRSPALTCNHEAPILAMGFPWQSALDPIGKPDDISGTLIKNQSMAVAYTIDMQASKGNANVGNDICPTLTNKMQGSSGWAPYNEDAHLVPVMHRAGDQANSETLTDMACTLNCDQGQRGGILFTAPADVAPTVSQGAPYSRTGNERVEADALAIAFKVRCGCEGGGKGFLGSEETAFTLSTTNDQHIAQPSIVHGTQDPCNSDIAFAQGRNNGGENVLIHAMQVRRLTPVECERLQVFPDNYTNIPWRKKDESPDGPRYKALGNSMAVPVMKWIGERIHKQTGGNIWHASNA